LNLGTCTFTVN